MSAAIAGNEAVKLEGISKEFGPLKALDDVGLTLRFGEIHALVGENGAGKSTLMNVLYGMLQPTAGRILVGGEDVTPHWTTRKAIARGIGMVHQHFSLVMDHSVLDNVIMPTFKWTDLAPKWNEHRKALVELTGRFGFDLSPDDLVETLSVGQRQQVEILKMLYQGAKVLILDEPTAVLTPQQADRLLQMLVQLREQGYVVVIITHKLEHALELADHITVLRGGRHVATVAKGEATIADIARMMVAQEVKAAQRPSVTRPGEVVLRMDGVSLDSGGVRALDGIGLEVREGEILGVAGVAGNGQSEMVETIAGLRQCAAGTISLRGRDVGAGSVEERRRGGIAVIPEDRHTHAVVGEMDIAANFILGREADPQFSRRGVLDRRSITEFGLRCIGEFDVRARSIDMKIEYLSGGNQQKVVVGRELSANPGLIVAHEPSRGLDFAATAYVRRRLVEAAERGAAVLLISSDLDELMELSTRVVVLYSGRIVGAVDPDAYDPEHLGILMAGARAEGTQRPGSGEDAA